MVTEAMKLIDTCSLEEKLRQTCYAMLCQVTSVMSNSVRPHRRQPTSLPRPWDSPGKNTGVGCHFFLQCMKVKSESEVAQSCQTLSDPMDCSLTGSSVHGIFQARILEWGAMSFSIIALVFTFCYFCVKRRSCQCFPGTTLLGLCSIS